jgi:predicted SnoaL-like aldol condensation-catalyzing enzyme
MIFSTSSKKGENPMYEENKALVRRVYEEVWNKGNLAAIDAIYAPGVVNHTLPPGLPKGVEGGKVFTGMYLKAFPDTKMTIEQQIAEGDKVVTHWIA